MVDAPAVATPATRPLAQQEQLLGTEEILAAPDVEYSTVKAWNGKSVRIQSLTAGDFIEWHEANETEAKRTAGLRLIVKSLVNAEGQTIMNEKHIPLLRAKSYKITEEIVKEILRLNGVKVRDDAVKNG